MNSSIHRVSFRLRAGSPSLCWRRVLVLVLVAARPAHTRVERGVVGGGHAAVEKEGVAGRVDCLHGRATGRRSFGHERV